MTTQQDETIQALARLIKFTQAGTLTWTSGSPWGELQDRDGFEVLFVFSANYQNRRLRLYGYRHRVDDPGPFGITGTTLSSVLTTRERKYPYWEEGVHLELTDLEGRSLWQFPAHSMIYDLLRAVRYQVADVKSFLQDVLKEG